MNRLKALIGLSILLAALQAWQASADSDHQHEQHEDHDRASHDKHYHAQHDDHDHEHEDEYGHLDEHEDAVVIPAEMAVAAGIKVAQAQTGRIARTIQVFGRLVVPPGQHASIQARFPGVVTQVKVSAGDRVGKGQLLAIVESNDSLRPYEIKAPLDAWVAGQKLNVGEQTGETPLFELVDDRQIWAELKIFPRYLSDVAVGQSVRLKVGQAALEGQIAALVRASDSGPFVTARVPVSNDERLLIAGDVVQAQIVIEEREVSLVIANRALQTFENKPVVFVRDGETYAPRPLVLGSGDGRYTEVLQGLEEGENYVVENSYLIKADLEKAGAAHEH